MKLVNVYIRSLKLLWSERLLTITLVAASVLSALIQLTEPILFGRVIDTLSKSGAVWPVLSFWALIGIVNLIVSVFQAVFADRLAHRQRLTIIGEVFERAIALPVTFHSERGSGKVVRAILAGADQLFGLWLTFLREHLSAIVGIAVLVPTALSMDWRLAILLFGLATVYTVANTVILNRTSGQQAQVEGYHQDLFGRVGDVIGNVTVVQSYTRLLDEKQALQDIMSRLLQAQYPVLTWWGLLTVITRISATLTMVCILGLGSYFAARGEISVGNIVVFTGFAGLLIAKLDQISAFFSRAINQAPALMNFYELLDQKGGAHEIPNAQVLTGVRGEVVFDHVSFKFPDSPNGVLDLNFTAGEGKTIALVGASGSGKTTTLGLLQRLFDPQDGRILIDGQDVRQFTLHSLRESIATVFQDSGLFNRSIYENIRVGRPAATEAEIQEAARQADAHEFILNKPGGYHFVIGERGLSMSGGERQRIAIARAILKQAPILIFDEATSALDNETEKRIQAVLANLRKDKTTFVIAHRLSTVVNADLILVFEKGRIAEAGTFSDLRQANGIFRRLVDAGELNTERRPPPQEIRI